MDFKEVKNDLINTLSDSLLLNVYNLERLKECENILDLLNCSFDTYFNVLSSMFNKLYEYDSNESDKYNYSKEELMSFIDSEYFEKIVWFFDSTNSKFFHQFLKRKSFQYQMLFRKNYFIISSMPSDFNKKLLTEKVLKDIDRFYSFLDMQFNEEKECESFNLTELYSILEHIFKNLDM